MNPTPPFYLDWLGYDETEIGMRRVFSGVYSNTVEAEMFCMQGATGCVQGKGCYPFGFLEVEYPLPIAIDSIVIVICLEES